MLGKEKLSSCSRLLRLVCALLEGVILKYILKCLISTDKVSDSMYKVGGVFKVFVLIHWKWISLYKRIKISNFKCLVISRTISIKNKHNLQQSTSANHTHLKT